MEYGFNHQGTTYFPSGEAQVVSSETTEERNKRTSRAEVDEFLSNPPERYFLYIQESNRLATTWTGDVLGSVFFGREYRDNFGGVRVPVTIRAINGCTYHGTFYKSAGDYARVKRSRHA